MRNYPNNNEVVYVDVMNDYKGMGMFVKLRKYNGLVGFMPYDYMPHFNHHTNDNMNIMSGQSIHTRVVNPECEIMAKCGPHLYLSLLR